jgi:hypothetical protein
MGYVIVEFREGMDMRSLIIQMTKIWDWIRSSVRRMLASKKMIKSQKQITLT